MQYIKYLISKSFSILVITTATAVLISYFFAVFVDAFVMVRQPQDLLSSEHYTFSIGDEREKIDDEDLRLSNLLEVLKNEKKELCFT